MDQSLETQSPTTVSQDKFTANAKAILSELTGADCRTPIIQDQNTSSIRTVLTNEIKTNGVDCFKCGFHTCIAQNLIVQVNASFHLLLDYPNNMLVMMFDFFLNKTTLT